jgi:peptide/nickel transport system permease protein
VVRYIAKRIGFALLTLFLFVTFLFFVVNILIPGDWTSQFILTGEERAALQEEVGLDRSLWDQYWTWITGVAALNLGQSFRGFPVWEVVRSSLASTLFVFVAAMMIAFPLGNWLGRIGAWKGRGWFLGWSTFVAVVMFTAFPPSLAFLLDRGLLNATSPGTYLDVTDLNHELWELGPPHPDADPLPAAAGQYTPSGLLWRMLLTLLVVLVWLLIHHRVLRRIWPNGMPPVAMVASLLVVPWLIWRLLGWQELAFDILGTILLLVVGVIMLFYGEMQLVTEAAMEDAVDEDFILTARAKGLRGRVIRDRHAARSAVLPVLSRLVVSLPYFLTGLAILEYVFEVPGGLGNLIFWAIRNQDTPVVVGAMVVVGAISLFARLATDVAYAVLDPRIRYEAGRLEVQRG